MFDREPTDAGTGSHSEFGLYAPMDPGKVPFWPPYKTAPTGTACPYALLVSDDMFFFGYENTEHRLFASSVIMGHVFYESAMPEVALEKGAAHE